MRRGAPSSAAGVNIGRTRRRVREAGVKRACERTRLINADRGERLDAARPQQLRDLDRVQGGALAELVAADEQVDPATVGL